MDNISNKVNTFRPSIDALGRADDVLHQIKDHESALPYTQFEYVSITFLSANTDMDVVHHLTPPTNEDIDYQVVRKDRTCDIYNDTSGTRRVWGTGYITVRSTAASAVVTLLLTVRR